MNTLNHAIPQPRYEEEHLTSSERFYREAIYLLEKTLSESPKSSTSLVEWIESYHELASIYEQKGDIVGAQKCLLIPHQSMLYMALNHHGDKEWEQVAIDALGLTLPKLMAFSHVHPTCEHCMRELSAQLALIEGNTKIRH